MQRHPAQFVYDFDAPPASSPSDLNRLLGGKGANLAVMANELRLPVPSGFTITTEASGSTSPEPGRPPSTTRSERTSSAWAIGSAADSAMGTIRCCSAYDPARLHRCRG